MKFRPFGNLAVAALCAAGFTGSVQAQPAEAPTDARQLVTMPALAQTILREEMLDNLGALHEVIALLAQDKLAAAADVAEQRIGHASMGKHAARARGQGPGRFMPEAMHAIGLSMHDAASEFAVVAKSDDKGKALSALQTVTGTCVACHAAYRTR